jgi:transposase
LEGLYRKASDPVLRTHLLMVWRMSVGDSVGEVARMVGYSEKWTREIARRYEEQGLEGLGDPVATAILEPRRGRCSTRRAKRS